MPWSTPFEDPIPLDRGRQLVTLKDAADHIRKLRKAEHDQPHWQLAVQQLIEAAEDRGPLMFARIAVSRALNHGRPSPEKEPRRKRAKTFKIIRSRPTQN
jgi:hypothetical protein